MATDRHAKRFLPQIGHWASNIVINQDGSLLAMFHLSGLAAELAGARAIISATVGDNQLDRNIADPRIEVWDHDVRQDRQRMSELPAISNWFAARFDDAYQASQGGATLFRNDLFLTVVMHPEDGFRNGMRAMIGGGKGGPDADDLMVQDFQGVLQRVEAGLFRYGARRLALREQGGVVFSEIAEALHLIANGHFRPLALTTGRMGHLIVPERIVFGHRDWQIMGEGEPLFGAILSFLDYPSRTSPTMFADLREVAFPITITNSRHFRQKASALSTISLRVKQMQSGNDAAKTQIQELTQDEDDVMSGRSAYVSHHFSVAVRAPSLIELDRRVARVQSLLSDASAGVTVIRETDAIKAAFYAQIPPNRRWRPRPGLVKSINAVAMAAKHGVPRGSVRGRWGAPILMLRTTSDTEYAFHFHAQGAEQAPGEDVGSFMVFGATGKGKTGLLGTLSMLALRVPSARVVIVDKGLGLSVMVRALGGAYLPITYGKDSGFAPLLAYQNTPEDVAHIVGLFRAAILSDGKGDITSDEDARLQRGVQRQMTMPPHMRSLAGVAVMLGQRDKDGAAARLGKWCRGQRLGWVMDNEADRVDLSARIAGIDPSALFKDEVACAPILADFFYRVRKLINGQPIMLVVDEAWQLDKVEAFRDDIQGHLKEIRKAEGVVALATQNVSTVVNSANAEDYRKQIPTKIFFADQGATRADLIEGLGLTEAEFLAVTEILPNKRHTFLLHRPGGSVLCRFDLSGAKDKVAVISARKSTYDLMNRLIARHGSDPEAWVPHFEQLAPSIAADPTTEQEAAA